MASVLKTFVDSFLINTGEIHAQYRIHLVEYSAGKSRMHVSMVFGCRKKQVGLLIATTITPKSRDSVDFII